ncbi:hypothetical protein ACWGNN_01240 [Streptomyces sp. NPDC055817]|uniref:hypothetical protein n=1 Tax=Streptomyces sp. NPDC059916 TaxID=3347001 RepID=UPI0036CFECB9
MAIELPDDLVEQQRAADQEHVKLLQLQERFTYPEGAETAAPARDWTEEQRAAWGAQWKRWADLLPGLHAAVTAHAKASSQSRYEVEMALKKRVRHPELEAA